MVKDNKSVGIAIATAVAILMGVILIQIIAEQTATKVQYETVTDTFTLHRLLPGTANTSNAVNTSDRYTLSKVSDAWRQDISECALATTVDPTSGATGNLRLYNQSGSIIDNGAEYVVVSGINSVRFLNAENINGTTSTTVTAVYGTCPVDYVSGWAQTVFKMVSGFFALALLIGAAFVIFKILKEEGVEIDYK
mgnify:CR=1 FL=1